MVLAAFSSLRSRVTIEPVSDRAWSRTTRGSPRSRAQDRSISIAVNRRLDDRLSCFSVIPCRLNSAWILFNSPGALLDQKRAGVGQRRQLGPRLRFQARLGQHVLRQQHCQGVATVAVGLADRRAGHLELARLDHHHPTDAGDHFLAEPGRGARRLQRDLVVAIEPQPEPIQSGPAHPWVAKVSVPSEPRPQTVKEL